MVSIDGNVPQPDFALKGSMVFRLSTARGLATGFWFAPFCACARDIPRSSKSASSCLCLRIALTSSHVRTESKQRMTTPTAVMMAMIVVVLICASGAAEVVGVAIAASFRASKARSAWPGQFDECLSFPEPSVSYYPPLLTRNSHVCRETDDDDSRNAVFAVTCASKTDQTLGLAQVNIHFEMFAVYLPSPG
jgi:hypothetical protein